MSGRKSITVTVPAWGGRDDGKQFLLKEMPAAQAEKWGWRAVLALKGTSAQIPESIAHYGMIAVAIRGINSFLASDVDFTKLEPLLDEMMTCVSIIRDPGARDRSTNQPIATPLVSPDDIEEVQTIGWLRSEVLRLHTNFSLVDKVLDWVSATKAMSPDS